MTFPFPFVVPRIRAFPDDFTSLLLHLDGENGATSFNDSSKYSHSVGVYGTGVTVSTTAPKFGSGAARFSNAGQMEILDDVSLRMGSMDFTIDFWANVSANKYQNAIDKGFTGSGAMLIQFTNAGRVEVYLSGGGQTGIGVINTNTWQHHALVRYSGTAIYFINGISQRSWANSSNLNNAERLVIGGRSNRATDNYFNGQIDEFRISKGVARWSSDFTPPTAPYQ